MDNSIFERIASTEALETHEDHAYLPKNPEEAESFKPHDWVIKAIKVAYELGRNHGRTATRKDIRSALGLA